LYTLSLFEQQGRLAASAVSGATKLTTEDGGPSGGGPAPNLDEWSGPETGLTFTALTDAPTDEVLTVVAGLPTDPHPPSLIAWAAASPASGNGC
jgi:hypothetical protein